MFLLDSLMISGIKWALKTVVTAAEAEMNDESVLHEALMQAEMRREDGEISADEYAEIEADLLARIREIKERKSGGAGAIEFSGAQPLEAGEGQTFGIEAEIAGDFHEPQDRSDLPIRSARADDADGSGEPVSPVEPVATPRPVRAMRAPKTVRATRTKPK